MERLPISLCMIVKNEEDWIAQCLTSVQSFVSEIIIVDTGSTDATKQLAEPFGAKFFDYVWQDDFAAARNFSLQQATQDWILVLDADEMIAEKDIPIFKKLIENPKRCSEFMQRHYCDDPRISNFTPVRGEFPELESNFIGYFESNCCRLFPNHQGLEFRGRVHELVEHSIYEKNDLEKSAFSIHRVKPRIHHFGHTQKVKEKKNKSKLYGSLGEEKATEMPTDWKALYELGVEYNCSGRLEESAQMFIKSIELKADYLDTWVNLGYVFCELGAFEQAEKALLHALKLAPRSTEALCNLGVVHLRLSRLQQAEQLFKAAVSLNPKYLNALCNLGKALANQGRLAEAAASYLDALFIAPNCGTALVDMATLYTHVGQIENAREMLLKAEKQFIPDEKTKVLLGEIKRQLEVPAPI